MFSLTQFYPMGATNKIGRMAFKSNLTLEGVYQNKCEIPEKLENFCICCGNLEY